MFRMICSLLRELYAVKSIFHAGHNSEKHFAKVRLEDLLDGKNLNAFLNWDTNALNISSSSLLSVQMSSSDLV